MNANGGTINAGNVTSYAQGVGATLPTNVTRSGYTFGGWYTSSSFSGSAVTKISTTDTGNKTYYAKWNASSYTLTLDPNGGKWSDGSTSTKNITVPSGASSKSYIPSISKVSSELTGWKVNSTVYSPSSSFTINNNITATATWYDKTSWVHFDVYNNSGGKIGCTSPFCLSTSYKPGYYIYTSMLVEMKYGEKFNISIVPDSGYYSSAISCDSGIRISGGTFNKNDDRSRQGQLGIMAINEYDANNYTYSGQPNLYCKVYFYRY